MASARIARRHRVSERAVQGMLRGVPLPPIRFHDLRHGAATPVLLGKVDMKVINETLRHSRHSFTADTYTSVCRRCREPLPRPSPSFHACRRTTRQPRRRPPLSRLTWSPWRTGVWGEPNTQGS
ncbi:tyrosine-type recombinase/integrase [Spirillospora sp. NPDC052269]